MSQTPASLLHPRTFFGRMIRPAIFVFFFGFLMTGVFSRIWETGIELPVIQMAQRQFVRLPADFADMPAVCTEGRASSTLQEQMCRERWGTLLFRAISVSVPFVFVIAFLGIAHQLLRRLYVEADRKLRDGRETFLGTVTDPAHLPNDFYGWFHCLNSVSVQLKNGKQMRVYVPVEADLPKPGEKLAVAPLGVRFGASRAMGIVFIAHISVVSGGP